MFAEVMMQLYHFHPLDGRSTLGGKSLVASGAVATLHEFIQFQQAPCNSLVSEMMKSNFGRQSVITYTVDYLVSDD
jgi:hypothetical protein